MENKKHIFDQLVDFEYILSVFKSIYQINGEFEIGYGTMDEKVNVVKSASSFFEQKEPIPIEKPIWIDWNEQSIPLFFCQTEDEIISERDGLWFVNYDIVANAFYFLSSWQEQYCTKRDSLDRFPFEESIQKKLKIAHVPVVNYYLDILKECLEKAYSVEIQLKNNASIWYTHDIDKMDSAWLEDGFSAIKSGRIVGAIGVTVAKASGKDAWFNLSEIAQLETEHNVKSTFFMLPRKGEYKGVKNADYDIESSKVQNEIDALNNAGFEIGIHGSYGTSANASRLKEEIERFNKVPKTNRFHFLSWNNSTYKILEENNIEKDSTLGFAEYYGFRHGICTPFKPYILAEKRATNFIEYPLNLMDTSFQQTKYFKIDKNEIPTLAKELYKEIEKFGGCLTILWHNNFFSDYKYKGWREVYVELMKLATNQGKE